MTPQTSKSNTLGFLKDFYKPRLNLSNNQVEMPYDPAEAVKNSASSTIEGLEFSYHQP